MTTVAPLDLTRLRLYLKHALSNSTIDSNLDQDLVINHAGDFLYNAHQWQFRYRPPVGLDFITGQSFMELPVDFGGMVAYQMTNSLNFNVTFTTPQQVAAHRASTITISQNQFWASVVQPSQVHRDQPPPPMRAEIWPTPGTDSIDVIQMWYLGKWRPLVETSDVADVPWYAEMALIECVRALGMGWAERLLQPSGGGEHELLQRVLESPIWETATTTDGFQQSNVGLLVGGAIQNTGFGYNWVNATASAVANPS